MMKEKRRIYVRNAPDFYPRRPIPYECGYCGEDRAHMFVEKPAGVRCGVCGAPAREVKVQW